jgi:phytoene desaturase (3,4-didehydrolycopene-forming)
VTVYEKNTFSGGRCSLLRTDGFRFDQGPSLLLMPQVFERAFSDLGEKMTDHIDLIKCDPNYVIHFGSQSNNAVDKITLQTDLTKLKKEMESIEEGSFEMLLKFLQEGHVHYSTSITEVLDKVFLNWYDFFNLSNLPLLGKLHIFDGLFRRASSYFKSSQLQQAFTFQSMYMGMSPYDAPATYNLLQYTELADGIWYPKGGFHQVVEKLEAIATNKYGVKFIYNSDVSKIVCDNDRVLGIEFSNGKKHFADIVVSNVDLIHTYMNLLPKDPYTKYLSRLKLTSSTFSFYWGMGQKILGLEGHNIFLAGDYRNSFDDIFEKLDLPEEPSFYVHGLCFKKLIHSAVSDRPLQCT